MKEMMMMTMTINEIRIFKVLMVVTMATEHLWIVQQMQNCECPSKELFLETGWFGFKVFQMISFSDLVDMWKRLIWLICEQQPPPSGTPAAPPRSWKAPFSSRRLLAEPFLGHVSQVPQLTRGSGNLFGTHASLESILPNQWVDLKMSPWQTALRFAPPKSIRFNFENVKKNLGRQILSGKHTSSNKCLANILRVIN